jgi:hypothetical protein
MFILDILITIILKNKIKIFKTFSSKKNIFTFIFLFLISMNSFNLYSKDFSNNTYLAYVKIKDDKINKISKNGLTTIKNLLSTRTSVTPYEVVGLNIKNDDIFYYPLIYWPLTKNLIKISDTEKKKIRNYLNNGGIIFFDIIGFSRETFDLKNKKFKNIKDFLNNIEITNLSLISKNHTLTKSFYLLKKFPGRWDNRVLLVESKNLEYKDGVNSVIIGFNDWAAAWALGDNNLPLYPVVPGGDRQRELAYRFGINIVMYSLTGNYKSDQIHSKSILNRLSKPN